jgi:hypothetical protein
MKMNRKYSGLAIAFAVLSAIACGSDDDNSNEPTTPIDEEPETSSDASSGSTPAKDAGTGIVVKDSGTNKPATTDDDAGSSTTSDAGDAGSATSECVVKDGCFCGTPVKMEDFLNACTDVDTVTKEPVIPLAKDGKVTPL